MAQFARRRTEPEVEPVRVLGRDHRASKGGHLTSRALRDAVGRTQLKFAKQSQIDRADISCPDSRSDFEDCRVATFRRYVEALGGSFELVALFGDKRIAFPGFRSNRRARRWSGPSESRRVAERQAVRRTPR